MTRDEFNELAQFYDELSEEKKKELLDVAVQFHEEDEELKRQDAIRKEYAEQKLHTNPYIRKLAEYCEYIKIHEKDFEECGCLNGVFKILEQLRWDDDSYVLDDYRSRKSTNNVMKLYARPKKVARPTELQWMAHEVDDFDYERVKGKLEKELNIELPNKGVREALSKYTHLFPSYFPKELPILEHFEVDYTSMGLWQAILLDCMKHIIGMRWHGCYSARDFVYSKDRFNEMESIRDAVAQLPDDFLPKFELYDYGYAIVTFYWFDGFSGLYKVKVDIDYDFERHGISSINYTQTKLIQYDCGIMF